MKLTDELKNKIDAFFDGKSEEELQYIANKYQSLQLHKTQVSGSFYCIERHIETGDCDKQCKDCKKHEEN